MNDVNEALGEVAEQLRGMGEDLRQFCVDFDTRQAIRHHEDCLRRALGDMQHYGRKAEQMADRSAKVEGLVAKTCDGQQAACYTRSHCWAYANALKHEKALREEFPGYVMPEDLRALWAAK